LLPSLPCGCSAHSLAATAAGATPNMPGVAREAPQPRLAAAAAAVPAERAAATAPAVVKLLPATQEHCTPAPPRSSGGCCGNAPGSAASA
jgi:hypothetical protein